MVWYGSYLLTCTGCRTTFAAGRTWALGNTGCKAGGCELETITGVVAVGCRIVVTILVGCGTGTRAGATSLCCTTWPGLTTVALGATSRTWELAMAGRTWVCTVGVPLTIENTTFAGGGRMPSIDSSLVASECRSKGKLFWKLKQNTFR